MNLPRALPSHGSILYHIFIAMASCACSNFFCFCICLRITTNQFILLPPNSNCYMDGRQHHGICFVDVLVRVFLNTSVDILAWVHQYYTCTHDRWLVTLGVSLNVRLKSVPSVGFCVYLTLFWRDLSDLPYQIILNLPGNFLLVDSPSN